jgi:hypothetical protein
MIGQTAGSLVRDAAVCETLPLGVMPMTRMLKPLLAVFCCGAVTAVTAQAAAADPVLYAAGDIACDPSDANFNGGNGTATACRQRATADLMTSGGFDAVIALGDLQYQSATLSSFQLAYDPTWGRLKSLTLPVVGNHEGTTPASAQGYCAYFGAVAHCNASGTQAGAAFYSFDLGAWHVVVLNSNCAAAGGCDAASPQYRWLQADLAANPRGCTLAAWHHPRWSSSSEGSNPSMQPIWGLFYANGGDLVLAGHSHMYERFAPIDGNGAVNAGDGMRSFVVGTGGVDFSPLAGSRAAGSEVRQNTTFGVLRLVLHPTSYEWTFVPASGPAFADSGAQSCRALPPAPAPAAPVSNPSSVPVATPPPVPLRRGSLLARWRLKAASARRALAHGRVHVPKRRWAPTEISVNVGGRLAARKQVRGKQAMTIKLASWSKRHRYRHRPVIVTIRRPL